MTISLATAPPPITLFQLISGAMSFLLIVLAAERLGKGCQRIHMPLISGFIFAGILFGPYIFSTVDEELVPYLSWIDALALPFIAFAAGSELRLKELQRRLKSILIILAVLVLTVFGSSCLTFFLIADMLPFLREASTSQLVAIALVGSSVLVAKSPSSAIAVIKEVRARGSYTQLVLGITVILDAVVILLFAVNASLAHVIESGSAFNFVLIGMLTLEIAFDLFCGLLLGLMLARILPLIADRRLQKVVLLLAGAAIFSISAHTPHVTLPLVGLPLFAEPLLVCMTAGCLVANASTFSNEFHNLIEEAAPLIIILFFTSVGIGLDLDVFKTTWAAGLILLGARLAAMLAGAWLGSSISGNSALESRLLGLGFITQAGISLSLAKEIGSTFQPWGSDLSTLLIGIIVVNTLIGPNFFKWALHRSGEAHPKGHPTHGHGHLAVIVGVDRQSIELGHLLTKHHWKVRILDTDVKAVVQLKMEQLDGRHIQEITPAELRKHGADRAHAVVAMLDGKRNFKVCEIAYEEFATHDIIVRLNDPSNIPRFHELGVSIVEPNSAIVNLLDHYVRSPSAAQLLLSEADDHDVIEVTVANPDLHCLFLRDLHLPADVLVLSVQRHGRMMLSHGYTRLRLGDEVTIVGSTKSLEEVELRFDPCGTAS